MGFFDKIDNNMIVCTLLDNSLAERALKCFSQTFRKLVCFTSMLQPYAVYFCTTFVINCT